MTRTRLLLVALLLGCDTTAPEPPKPDPPVIDHVLMPVIAERDAIEVGIGDTIRIRHTKPYVKACVRAGDRSKHLPCALLESEGWRAMSDELKEVLVPALNTDCKRGQGLTSCVSMWHWLRENGAGLLTVDGGWRAYRCGETWAARRLIHVAGENGGHDLPNIPEMMALVRVSVRCG